MLPVVVLTIFVLIVGMMLGSVNTHRATGLFAVLGIISERLALVGILNVVVGVGLALLVAGKLHLGMR